MRAADVRDDVVVCGGTTGSATAARLPEDERTTVLLPDRGGDGFPRTFTA